MRHLMSPLDFTVEEIDKLLNLASDIEAHPDKYAHACEGKKLATLFYEPSTRTRLSHEAAMLNLGGSVLGFSSAASSSATKGETVADTIRMISCFADICACCKRELSSENFYYNHRTRIFDKYCKECRKKRSRQYLSKIRCSDCQRQFGKGSSRSLEDHSRFYSTINLLICLKTQRKSCS